MPLHLLGKKSWNVYNVDNIAKVKRDEAAAAARERAEEQRNQEIDAERRIRLLRGEPIEAAAVTQEPEPDPGERRRRDPSSKERKRKRLAGEDETDRDIRYVREDRARATEQSARLAVPPRSKDAPLTDHTGHINLFPSESHEARPAKNAEVEAERAGKRREFEDQYTMRFANAAGFRTTLQEKPWYHAGHITGKADLHADAPGQDVWGNEDPERKKRERMRIAADDPLAAMREGAAAVRRVEKQRSDWNEERRKELEGLHRTSRRREKSVDSEGRDGLEGFSLDSRHLSEVHSKHRRHKDREKDMERRHHHRRPQHPHRHRHRSP